MPYMSLCVVMIDPGNLRDQIFPRTGFAPSVGQAVHHVHVVVVYLYLSIYLSISPPLLQKQGVALIQSRTPSRVSCAGSQMLTAL